jgi:hypothetical protein
VKGFSARSVGLSLQGLSRVRAVSIREATYSLEDEAIVGLQIDTINQAPAIKFAETARRWGTDTYMRLEQSMATASPISSMLAERPCRASKASQSYFTSVIEQLNATAPTLIFLPASSVAINLVIW